MILRIDRDGNECDSATPHWKVDAEKMYEVGIVRDDKGNYGVAVDTGVAPLTWVCRIGTGTVLGKNVAQAVKNFNKILNASEG